MQINVLLVEDDDMARGRLERVILKEGYNVFAASDGYEALNLFNSNKPDIVVTDIKMPRVDGMEVLHRIKEMSRTTEVILITGHGDADIAIHALREGALDYIKKPIDIDQLIISMGRAKEKISEKKKIILRNSILVLEDDDTTRIRLANVLKKEDYKVFMASDGEEGLKIFSENKIDIVLTDLRMPKVDGLKFLDKAKEITSDCEIIILSGYGDEAAAIEAMRNGAINFIRKPLDLEQLLVSTQKAIDKLNLQRSYFYKSRELELTKQIMNMITSEKGSQIELPANIEKDYIELAIELINIMNISYVIIDREMKIEFMNKNFANFYKFSYHQIDKVFFKRLGLSNIDTGKFEENVTAVFESKRAKIIKMTVNDKIHIIMIKVFFTNNNESSNERIERALLFFQGEN